MNTVILMWNPEISSFRLVDYECGMEDFEELNLNWSVREPHKINIGDRFYMVRVGKGRTGIVMSGLCLSHPYYGEDWTDRNKIGNYIDLDIHWMFNLDHGPILDTYLLAQAIPDFDWTGGHSGRVLEPKDAAILEKLWEEHLAKNAAVLTDPKLVIHSDESLIDYVPAGISPRAHDQIKGIQLLDQFLGPDTNHLDKAVLRDLHFDRNNFSIDILIQPYHKDNLLLKFHFTDILDFRWDSPLFDTYLEPSCIYCQYSYLVTEFTNVNITISSESLEVSLLEVEEKNKN